MGCSSTIIRKSHPRRHLPQSLYKQEPADCSLLSSSIPPKIESDDDSEPPTRRHKPSVLPTTSRPPAKQKPSARDQRKIDSAQRQKRYNETEKAKALATRALLLDHIKTTLPHLPSVDELDIMDITIHPNKCKKYGYAWEFANRYSFPTPVSSGSSDGIYKVFTKWTTEEHEAAERALRDGSLRAILDEDMEDAMRLEAVEAEQMDATKSVQGEAMSIDSDDEEESSLSEFEDPDGSDGNDYEPDRKTPIPIDNSKKRKRRLSDGNQKSEQEKYRDGPMARAIELKKFLLNHIKTALPFLSSVRTIDDVYLAPYRQEHIGYTWKFTKNYKAFPRRYVGRQHKALNNFTNPECAALKEAIRRGWLTAVLKDDFEPENALTKGIARVSRTNQRPQRRKRNIDSETELSSEDESEENSDSENHDLSFFRLRSKKTREILLEHIHKTLPQLASSTTIKEVFLNPPRYPRARYLWTFSNGYSFPSRSKGYKGIKAFNNWTCKDHEALKKALEVGDLRAVLKEGPDLQGDNDADADVGPIGNTDGLVNEVEKKLQVESESKQPSTASSGNLIPSTTLAHNTQLDSTDEAPLGASATTTLPTSKQQPNSPQQAQQSCGFKSPAKAYKARTDATKRLLLTHINQTLPSLTTIQSLDQIFLVPHCRGPDITYDWQLSNGYTFPKYVSPERSCHLNSKAVNNWTVAEHKELKEALEKGWLRAVIRDMSVKPSSKKPKIKVEPMAEEVPRVQARASPILAPCQVVAPASVATPTPQGEEQIKQLKLDLEKARQEIAQHKRRESILCSLLTRQTPGHEELGSQFERAFVFRPEMQIMPLLVRGRVDAANKRVELEFGGGEEVVIKTLTVESSEGWGRSLWY